MKEEGPMAISLLEYAGVTDGGSIRFVIYDEANIEVEGNREEQVLALEAIQLTYRYRPESESEGAYGVMDVGNGVDRVKRVVMIDDTVIAIGKDYYTITGGETLKALVEK